MTEQVPNFLQQMEQLTGRKIEFGEFKPCASYYPAMDMLLYLEKDCGYVSQYIRDTNIELLWDNHPDHGGKLVGVKIMGFSHVAPPAVLEAYMRDDEEG